MITGIIPSRKNISIGEIPVLSSNSYSLSVGDELILDFFNDLSKLLLKNKLFKSNPSFVALGFWLRKSNLRKILDDNSTVVEQVNCAVRPLGKVFHLCPSNVDTMFIYSLVLSLLGGNKNVVRISSKSGNAYITELFKLFNGLLIEDKYKIFSEYISVISYDRSDKLNEEISMSVNGRIVWGGDETVNQFKRYKTKPKVKDLFFTDKISFSVINADSIDVFEDNLNEICRSLYNDIYTFDQKGCSSPHSIFIICKKNNSRNIVEKLYNGLVDIAQKDYKEEIGSIASLKFNQNVLDIISESVVETICHSNYLTLTKLNGNQIPHSCGAGYLYYGIIDSLNDIGPYIDQNTQTITHWGITDEEIRSFMNQINVEGVDRIVPIGKALEFDYIWDGYNIFTEMLAFKSIKV